MRGDSDGDNMSTHRQIIFAAAALFLYAVSYSWQLDVLPTYLDDIACEQLFNASISNQQCVDAQKSLNLTNNVSKLTNDIDVTIDLPFNVIACVAAVALVPLSDFVGRKAILAANILLSATMSIGIALVPHDQFPSVGPWLSGISGFGGGLFAYLAVTFAFVSDTASRGDVSKRAVLIGRVESACWIGLAVAPIIASAIADALAPNVNVLHVQRLMWFPFGVQLLAACIVIFGMRETIQPGQRGKISWVRATTIVLSGVPR